ncbi:MAG: efflux RND transporter periplasmic adaptor subunit [Gemmatimonadaceae bacterium]|nr:efflux RND transporter periplasmic adaptor subunit [Gemmatimonadaceae bacterium]
MPIKTVLLVTAGLVAGVSVTYFAMAGRTAPAEPTEAKAAVLPPGVVELAPEALKNAGLHTSVVASSVMQVLLDVTGTIAAEDSRVAHVRPLGRGVIETVSVTLGQTVRKGDALLTYDNIELGEQVGAFLEARAALRTAESDREVRRLSLARADALIKVEGIALQTVELRRAELKAAESAVASAEATVARIEEQLHRFGLTDPQVAQLNSAESPGGHRAASHNILRAPVDGIVTRYDVAPGELVEPQRELFTITDLSTVWVMGDIYEQDVARVRAGTDAQVRVDAYPNRPFSGKLTYVSSVIDPKTRTAKARVVVPNVDGALKLDMFARVAVPTPDRREALTVPAIAVQYVEDQAIVFVRRDDGRFARRNVVIGAASGDVVEIRDGLKVGEVVVGTGSFYLKTALLRERIGGGE